MYYYIFGEIFAEYGGVTEGKFIGLDHELPFERFTQNLEDLLLIVGLLLHGVVEVVLDVLADIIAEIIADIFFIHVVVRCPQYLVLMLCLGLDFLQDATDFVQ